MTHFARPSARPAAASVRHKLRDRLHFAALLVAWGIGCLGWNLIAWPLARLLPEGSGRTLGEAGIQLGFRAMTRWMQASGLFRFDTACLEQLGAEPALVIVANHPGLLDAVLVIARLRRTVCIAKPDLWRNPFLGGGIQLAGYPRHDSPLTLVRGGVDALRRGRHLLVFPEGTRTPPGAAMQAFGGGFALIARVARVPVQTLLIETDNPYFTKGWPLFRLPPLPVVYRVRLGRRFDVTGDTHAFADTLQAYVRTELRPR